MWRWCSRSRAASAALALLLAAGARAQEEWRPVLTQDGVEVWERNAPDRALPDLRAQVEIDAPLATVLAVLSDVPRQTEWMYQCTESRIVRRDSPDVALVYHRIGTPWPAADRDAVLDAEIARPSSERAVASFHAVADPTAPPVAGVVRMPQLDGRFELTALSPERTAVTYRVDIDPGGALPGWLARRYVRELPLETLLGLRREAAPAAAKR